MEIHILPFQVSIIRDKALEEQGAEERRGAASVTAGQGGEAELDLTDANQMTELAQGRWVPASVTLRILSSLLETMPVFCDQPFSGHMQVDWKIFFADPAKKLAKALAARIDFQLAVPDASQHSGRSKLQ